MADVVVFGASRGLGAALATAVPEPGERVWCIARSRPALLDRGDGIERRWIAHDLADPSAITTVATAIGDRPVGLLVYNAGIWESAGFADVADAEIRAIVDVNLTSLLLAVRHLAPNLRAATHAKVVLIGSTCGLENEGTTSVAYAATKFAVRGAAHALRELLRPDGIAVTVLSPGSMATDIALEAGADAALAAHGGKRIPVADIVAIVRMLRALSPAACVKEIDVPALADTDV
ncbi:MAG: SDR family NAD(P)-dependent oxidoreductase [Hyphomicrobiaceae bacterium]